jgi:argininosuccinate lyase
MQRPVAVRLKTGESDNDCVRVSFKVRLTETVRVQRNLDSLVPRLPKGDSKAFCMGTRCWSGGGREALT